MARIEIKEGRIVGKMKRDGDNYLEVVLRGLVDEPEVMGAAMITGRDCRSCTIEIHPIGGAIVVTLKKGVNTRTYVLTYEVLVEEGRRKKILELMLQKTYFSRVWGRKLPKREK